jgi:hypothetical protein
LGSEKLVAEVDGVRHCNPFEKIHWMSLKLLVFLDKIGKPKVQEGRHQTKKLQPKV